MRFLMCALLAVTATSAREICKSGTVERIDSDLCVCVTNGMLWVCDKGGLKEWFKKEHNVEEIGDKCEPGKKFKSSCDLCICAASGKVDDSYCEWQPCDRETIYAQNNSNGTVSNAWEILQRSAREVKKD